MTVGGVNQLFYEKQHKRIPHTKGIYRASAPSTEKGAKWHTHVYWHQVASVTAARSAKRNRDLTHVGMLNITTMIMQSLLQERRINSDS